MVKIQKLESTSKLDENSQQISCLEFINTTNIKSILISTPPSTPSSTLSTSPTSPTNHLKNQNKPSSILGIPKLSIARRRESKNWSLPEFRFSRVNFGLEETSWSINSSPSERKKPQSNSPKYRTPIPTLTFPSFPRRFKFDSSEKMKILNLPNFSKGITSWDLEEEKEINEEEERLFNLTQAIFDAPTPRLIITDDFFGPKKEVVEEEGDSSIDSPNNSFTFFESRNSKSSNSLYSQSSYSSSTSTSSNSSEYKDIEEMSSFQIVSTLPLRLSKRSSKCIETFPLPPITSPTKLSRSEEIEILSDEISPKKLKFKMGGRFSQSLSNLFLSKSTYFHSSPNQKERFRSNSNFSISSPGSMNSVNSFQSCKSFSSTMSSEIKGWILNRGWKSEVDLGRKC